MGGYYSRGFNLLRLSYPGVIFNSIWEKLVQLGIKTIKGSNNIFDFLSDISIVAKHNGERFHRHWRFFVDLANLGGYQEADASAFAESVKFWIQGETHFGEIPGFDEYFEAVTDELYSKIDFFNEVEDISVDEFVARRDLWGASGGLLLRGWRKWQHPGGIKNTKSNYSILTTAEAVKNEMFSSGMQTATAIPKYEFGKVRAIINSDLTLYLQMSWLSMVIEGLLRNIPGIVLSYDEDGRVKMEERIANSFENGLLKYPIDQSKFDHKPTKAFIIKLLLFLKKIWMRKSVHKLEGEIIWDKLIYSMSNCSVKVGDEVLEYRKGLLSGWRWTTLLVTLTNYIELQMAEKIVEKIEGRKLLASFEAMGDDDRLELRSRGDVMRINLIYKALGLEVNPKKTFLAKDRDEFLRKVYTQGMVSGYPARILASILYNKREPPDKFEVIDRVDSNVSNWWLAIQRGCDYDKTIRLMTTDIGGLTNLKREQVTELLFASRLIGGGGIGDGTRYIQPITVKEHTKIKVNLANDIISDIGQGNANFLAENRFATMYSKEIIYKKREMNVKYSGEPKMFGPFGYAKQYSINFTKDCCIDPSNYIQFDDNGRLSEDIRARLTQFSLSIEDRLYRKSSRNFYKSWCTSSFPTHLPRVLNITSQSLPVFFNYIFDRIVNREIMRRRPTLAHLIDKLYVGSKIIRASSASVRPHYLS